MFTLTAFFTLIGLDNLSAQECKLNCNDLVNISMDSACMRTVEVADVLNGDLTACADSNLVVEIDYPYPDLTVDLAPNMVDKRLIQYTLIYRVRDTVSGNSCWGRIKIEDKYPPQIMCGDDTISCFIAEEYPAILIEPTDNCMYPARTEIISHRWIDYNCDSLNFVGRIERTVRALDIWGNSQTCDQTLYIERETLDSLVCPPDTLLECCDPRLQDTMYYDIVDGKRIPKPIIDPLGNSIGLVDPPFVLNDGDTVYVWPNTAFCQIYAHYKDHIIEACGHTYKIRREWKIVDWCSKEDTVCTQWIKIIDTLAPVVDLAKIDTIYGYTSKHECKAHVDLVRPPIIKECWNAFDEVTVRYSVEVPARHGVSQGLYYSGEIKPGTKERIYLPAGWHVVNLILIDGCLNSTTVQQIVYVVDEQPPTPICDEITQVTLDPEECWARVYAESLDDGSHDNCCNKLHFAVASMDSIEYWRNHWRTEYEECLGHYAYHAQKDEIEETIEHWINCYVFNDYIDLSNCGRDTVVLRVYEACGLPLYDPHIFKGTKHNWYCFNVYDDFACFFKVNYHRYTHYESPRPYLGCNYDDLVYDFDEECLPLTFAINTAENKLVGDYTHVVEHNYVCCEFQRHQEPTDKYYALYLQWKANLAKYPELAILCESRYTFPHLYNDCMVEIIKDDKVAPICDAPDDKTIFCDGVPYWDTITIDKVIKTFDNPKTLHTLRNSDLIEVLGNISVERHSDPFCCNPDAYDYPWNGGKHGYYAGPGHSVYGDDHSYGHDPCYENVNWEPVYCRLWLLLDRYDDPSYGKPDPTEQFDEPVIDDNCGVKDIVTDTKTYLNECGNGYLTRTWTVYDYCDNSSVCYQKIVVKARSDFEVCFPGDTLVDCTTSPILEASEDGVGYPIISDDDCEFIGVNYEDQKFDIVDEACYKIFRTWTIIDWCVYNPDLHDRYAEVIVDDRVRAGEERPCIYRKLKDNGDGIMTYLQVIKVYDGNAPTLACSDPFEICIDDEDCILPIVDYELGTATDECTPVDEIAYRWYVDPFIGGDEDDYIYSSESDQNRLKGQFPVGLHRAYLIASDKCGNEDTCYVDFEVKDCKKPTPYCYHGIATVLMPTTGAIKVWAKDLDAGSFDNCDKGELTFSFSDDIDDQSREFTCDSVGTIPVTIYVWDASGNYDFCETYLSIQGNGVCNDSSAASIAGVISTENSENVQDVSVDLRTSTNPFSNFTTGADGLYAFNGVPMDRQYRVKAVRNNDFINGVSTLDLVFIQKHILGIQKLSSPYKIIAADINKSNTVTALDIVELRKLILGLYDEFPNNDSWRFVSKDYQFADRTQPWGFPFEVVIDKMSEGQNLIDLIGIKIGDVNSTALANGLLGASVRTSGAKLAFTIEEQSLNAGQEFRIPVRAKNFLGVEGYQFTINLNGVTITEIQSGSINVSEDNFGFINSEKGLVTTSWNSFEPVSIDKTDDLFYIVVRADQNVNLSEAFKFNSAITKSEAYAAGQVMNVSVEFTRGDALVETGDFELYQNNPNPFSKTTTIGFVLPVKGSASLKILDVTGKIVKEYTGDFTKGYNEIRVDKKDMPASGVLYYQLDAQDYTATKKMVVIE